MIKLFINLVFVCFSLFVAIFLPCFCLCIGLKLEMILLLSLSLSILYIYMFCFYAVLILYAPIRLLINLNALMPHTYNGLFLLYLFAFNSCFMRIIIIIYNDFCKLTTVASRVWPAGHSEQESVLRQQLYFSSICGSIKLTFNLFCFIINLCLVFL